MKYRIKDATLAVRDDNGQRTMVTVPSGSILWVDERGMTASQMVSIEWNGAHLLMFLQDLQMRGEAITCQAA